MLTKIRKIAASDQCKSRTQELLKTVHVSLYPLVEKIDLGLVEWILDALNETGNCFEDKNFLNDLCNGFAQTGVLPP